MSDSSATQRGGVRLTSFRARTAFAGTLLGCALVAAWKPGVVPGVLAKPVPAVGPREAGGGSAVSGGKQYLYVYVDWRSDNADMPYVRKVAPDDNAQGAELIGMRLDSALKVLRGSGWKMQAFDMKTYWEDHDRSMQRYTLTREP